MKRFASILCVLMLMLASFTAGQQFPRGDVDLNGEVNIGDVVALIDYLLNGEWAVDPDAPEYGVFTANGVSFTMLPVKSGTFMMGATIEQGMDAMSWERPVHYVTLSSFSIGETEVTQELWEAVMGSNPSYFNDDPQRPVEMVSWQDCQLFIEQLNELTGKNFRLPTEAEWEFAARGGNQSMTNKYAGSGFVDNVAWYWNDIPSQHSGNPGYGTQPVGTKMPNELGLYDMSGNVWEWCQDWYGSYTSGDQIDPTGPYAGTFRIFRGGSWSRSAESCRVSYRNFNYPSSKDETMGLRIAL